MPLGQPLWAVARWVENALGRRWVWCVGFFFPVAAAWFVVGGGIIRRGRGAAGGGLFTGGACVCVGGSLFDIRVREIVACWVRIFANFGHMKRPNVE